MVGARGIASVRQASAQPGGKSETPLHIAQQKNAAIRRQKAAIKSDVHLLAANRWQRKRQEVIVVHGGCGAP
jgi:hypothetical protein